MEQAIFLISDTFSLNNPDGKIVFIRLKNELA